MVTRENVLNMPSSVAKVLIAAYVNANSKIGVVIKPGERRSRGDASVCVDAHMTKPAVK